VDELIAALVAEQDYLDEAIRDAPEAHWNAASPAEGWLMRDCIAHLAEGDTTAVIIAETHAYPEGDHRPGNGVLTAGQVDARALSIEALLAWWRACRARLAAALRPLEARDRLPWAGNEMSVRSFTTARLMEAWSHGLDAIETAGVTPVDSDRLHNIAHLGYATRDFSYHSLGLEPNPEPLHVALRAPSGATWTWGPEDAEHRIIGTAGDFCRVVTQRIYYTDTKLEYSAGAAEEFLQIAQAFAGPRGEGRAPKGED
jgi:uncharacterized protein (TIGR03084 family)